MSETQPTDLKAIGARIREARKRDRYSLEQFADQIREHGCGRPSGAKISRVETGIQPVPLDILDAVASLTNIPTRELRPDLAARFVAAAE